MKKQYQSTSIKLISNRTVDKDVQSMFFPLNLMHFIILCPKYRIKHDIITPNSLISVFVSMIMTLIAILTFVHSSYVITLNISDHASVFLYWFNCAFVCFGFALNFMIGLNLTKSNVQFVLMFQKVHRFINNQSGFNQIIIWTWIIVIMVFSSYVIVLTYLYANMSAKFSKVYAAYFFIIFDVNIVYAIRVIRLLENKVVLWNIREFNPLEIENIRGAKYSYKVLQAYAEILECYDIFKHNFQAFVRILSLWDCFFLIFFYLILLIGFRPFSDTLLHYKSVHSRFD